MRASISDLVGKTLASVKVTEDEIFFETVEGQQYKMYHSQDCCESVTVEDVAGDIDDIIGEEILSAEEVTSETPPEGVQSNGESELWTFYKIDTRKGGVTIRWYGTSNGYYSESVDFDKVA